MFLESQSKLALAGSLLFASALAFGQSNAFLEHEGELTPPEGGVTACTADALINQGLNATEFATARTSDQTSQLLVADNFTEGGLGATVTTGEATDLVIWGIQAEFVEGTGFVAGCDIDGADFELTSWTDDGGVPGTMIDSAVVTPGVTDTGIGFAFTTIFEASLPVGSLNLDNAGWISVQREPTAQTGGGNDCLFLWVDNTDGAVGDDNYFQVDTSTGDPVPPSDPTAVSDQAVCVEGTGTIEGPEIPADAVVGFSFIGTVSGVGGTGTWASDLLMDMAGPSGSSAIIGGLSSPNDEDWDFDGSGSTNDGTYESDHSGFFLPDGTLAEGQWNFEFCNDFSSGAPMTWTATVVTLILGNGTEIPLEIPEFTVAGTECESFALDVEGVGPDIPESQPVPVNSPWALALLVLLMAGLGVLVIRRMA